MGETPAVPGSNMKPGLAASNNPKRLLDQLDELKSRFGAREQGIIERLLSRLPRLRFKDAEALLRYHEILLFLRAYPQSERTVRLVDRELSNFAERVNQLEATGADLSVLEHPEVSGIAGTSVTDTFTYYIVRWLVKPAVSRVGWRSIGIGSRTKTVSRKHGPASCRCLKRTPLSKRTFLTKPGCVRRRRLREKILQTKNCCGLFSDLNPYQKQTKKRPNYTTRRSSM